MAGKQALKGTFAAALFGAAVLGPSVIVAADWSAEPTIKLSGEYNDNHRLAEAPEDPITVSGAMLDALVVLGANTPQTSFSLTPRFRTDYFPGDPEEETDSLSLRFGAQHRTEKAVLGLNANYIDDELLWGYLPGPQVSEELGNPTRGEDIDTSSVVNERQRFDISPEISFALTPRWHLDVSAEYIDVDYSKTVEDETVPYKYLNGAAGLRYRLSNTSELSLNAAVGRYEPDGDVDTTGYGLTAEWSRQTSETAKLYFRGGFNQVEIADENGDLQRETGFSGGAGVRWQFEVTSIVLDATHYVDPNSTGSVVNRDQIQLWLNRRFAPMFSMYLGARGIQDSGVGDSNEFRDRKYATGSVGFDWRFARRFTLVGGYTYVWREYEGRSSDAESNALSLGVVYAPQRR